MFCMPIRNISELIIDNDRMKILKYIKRSKSATFIKIHKKFNYFDEELIHYLISKYIIVCTNPVEKVSECGDYWVEYSDDSVFKLDTKGKHIVENDIIVNRKWKIPIVISVIALLKSFDKEFIIIFDFICGLLSNN